MKTPLQTVTAFYQAIIDKQVDSILSNYVPSEDTYVILEGPRYTTVGYDNIAKGWRDFCDSALSLTVIQWTEGPFEKISDEMAFIAGQINLTVQLGEKSFTVLFRATFVLIRPENFWQITHEHVSGPLPDPYGIGDWLKKA
jgi:ketosteroid isomerase-like protein